MAGTGGNELIGQPKPTSLPESATTGFREVAKVASSAIDLRDGFRNERRTPEYRAIHGLSPDADDTHEDWVARLHPEDRERTVRQFLDAVKGPGEQFSSQYRIIRPNDGQLRWIATEARIERDPDGRPLRLIGAHIDITELALAKETLARERGAVPPDRQQRAGADVGHQDRPHPRLRQPGLSGISGRSLRRRAGVRLAKDPASGRHGPHREGERCRRGDAEAVRAGRALSPGRWAMALDAIGIAAALGSDRTAYRLHRRRPRYHGGQGSRDRVSGSSTKRWNSGSRSAPRSCGPTKRSCAPFSRPAICIRRLLDLQGNVVYANSTSLAGIRASAADVAGKPFWETPGFPRPRACAIVVDAFDAVVKGESVRHRDAPQFADRRALFRFHHASGVRSARRRFRRAARSRRHHRSAAGRGGAAPIPEDGRGRPADRRRRPRFQQSADHHTLRDRLPAPPRSGRRPPPPLHRCDFGHGRPRLETDRPAAGLCPAAAADAAGVQRRLAGRKHRAADPPADGRPNPDQGRAVRSPCFATADVAQFETALVNLAVNARDAMAGRGQPGHPRRGGRRHSGAARPAAPRRAVRRGFGHRYRNRYRGRQARSHLRTVLHHQGCRQGHRPRS